MTEQRVAIVTGAAWGIGAAVAQRLARTGTRLPCSTSTRAPAATVKAITEAGGKAVAVGCDVSKADQVTAAVERVVSGLGAPTILVNNAGVLRDNLLFKMSEDDWDTVMSVHLKGSFLMSRACQAHMVEAGYGRIVFLSSTSALGNRGQANYAAKAGLAGAGEDCGDRAGQVRRHRERDRARFHRDHDRGHRGPGRRRLRGVQEGDRRDHPGELDRHAGRHRRGRVVLLQRGGRVRLRPGAVRRRRTS